jgi:hypothetical protein
VSSILLPLLDIGAQPNDKPNGGSSALDTCLWHLNFGSFALYRRKRLRSKYELSKGLECARERVDLTFGPNGHREGMQKAPPYLPYVPCHGGAT